MQLNMARNKQHSKAQNKTKLKFYYTCFYYQLSVAGWRSQSLQLAPRHAVQCRISSESMATCVNLTDSGFSASFDRLFRVRSLEHLPFNHLAYKINQLHYHASIHCNQLFSLQKARFGCG